MSYMFGSIAVVVCCGIVFSFVYNIVQLAMKHKEAKLRIMRGEAQGESPSLAAAHAEIAALKQRVQVLERLATDDDRRLAGEIERLRREPARV